MLLHFSKSIRSKHNLLVLEVEITAINEPSYHGMKIEFIHTNQINKVSSEEEGDKQIIQLG